MVRRRARSSRRGITVVEAIVALSVASLVIASAYTVALAGRVARERSLDRLQEIAAAAQLLERVSSWSTAEMEQRVGTRRQSQFSLRIVRLQPTLFAVAVLDSIGRREILWSAVRHVASETSQ